MIGLLQRVSQASVAVEGVQIAVIGEGLLVLLGVERGDSEVEAKRLAERLVEYRVFPDAAGRMNRSVRDIDGRMLLVPQFTLAADTQKGTRPGFSRAAEPAQARRLFEGVAAEVEAMGVGTATGQFGANMRVSLVNEGPVTFWLHVAPHG